MALKLLGSLESSGGDLQVLGTVKTSTHGDGLVFGSPTTVKFKLGVYGANDLLFKDPNNNVLMTLTAAGNVGIGTAPSSNLHVHGAGGSGVATQIKVTQADDGAGHPGAAAILQSSGWGEAFLKLSGHQISAAGGDFNVTSSTDLALQTNGTNTRMFIRSDGNIGIGTTAPLEKLHVAGKINSSNNIVSNSTYTMFTGRSSRTVDDYGGLNKEYFKANLVTPGTNTTGESSAHGIADLRFQLANSAGNTGMSDIMTLRSGGNVGIGTTSPNEKLTVAGNIHAYAPSGINAGLFASTAAGATSIAIRSSGVTFFNAGNVGIGTTTPQRILDVNVGGNSGVGASFAGTISAGEYQGIHFGYSEAGNGNYRHSAIVFERDDATHGDARGKIHILNSASGVASANLGDSRLTVLPSGNVGIATTSPNAKLDVVGNTRLGSGTLHVSTDQTFGTGFTYSFRDAVGILNPNGTSAASATAVMSIGGMSNGHSLVTTGNVGIGTTAPAQKLDVRGKMLVANDTPDAPIGSTLEVYRNGSTAELSIHQDNGSAGSAFSQLRFRNGGNDTYLKVPTSGQGLIIDTESQANALVISTTGNATFAGDVTVGGNLIVNGTTTTLNTTTVEVEDNIIQLNTTQGTPDTATAATSGISVYRGDGVTQASLIFDDGDDTWDLTNNLNVAGSINAIGAIEVKDSDGSTTLSHVRAMSNTTEGWLSVSNGSNWGLIARGVANEPRLGAWYGGVLKIEGFHSSDGATGSNAIDFAQFQFGNNHFQMNAATSTFAGNVTLGSASPVLKIDATGTGNPEIFFTRITGDDQNAKIRLLNNQLAFENEGDPDSSFLFQGRAAGAGSLSDFLKIEDTGITAPGATFAGSITAGGDITATGADFTLAHAAGATVYLRRDDTSISDGNVLGLINFQGDDPTDNTFNTGVALMGRAAGDWASGSYESEFILQTRNTSGGLVTALTVNEAQNATFAGTASATRFQGTTYPYNTTVGHTANATTTYIEAGSSSKTSIELSGGDVNSNIKFITPNASNVETLALTIDSSQNATFAGRVTHNGIELTSGFAVDQIKEFPMTFQLAANTWTDTGIDGADLSTGTYAMQVYVSDFGVGGQHYYEYYSATISWYGGATNSTTVDEIPVHRAGHAPNAGDIQFRTQRASGSDSHDLMLQVKTNLEYTEALDNDDGGKIMRFKFRRLM